jgi:hypothetical protein
MPLEWPLAAGAESPLQEEHMIAGIRGLEGTCVIVVVNSEMCID